MSRTCQITGKKVSAGNNRPFSLKATKRTFRPNLFSKKMYNPETGKVEKMKLSAKAIKTLKKWAKKNNKEISYSTKKLNKGATSAAGEGKHIKKEKLTPKQKKEMAAAKAEAEKTKSVAEEKIEAKEA